MGREPSLGGLAGDAAVAARLPVLMERAMANAKTRAGAYTITTPSVRIAHRHYTRLCPATGRPLTLSWFDAPWFEMVRRLVRGLRRAN